MRLQNKGVGVPGRWRCGPPHQDPASRAQRGVGVTEELAAGSFRSLRAAVPHCPMPSAAPCCTRCTTRLRGSTAPCSTITLPRPRLVCSNRGPLETMHAPAPLTAPLSLQGSTAMHVPSPRSLPPKPPASVFPPSRHHPWGAARGAACRSPLPNFPRPSSPDGLVGPTALSVGGSASRRLPRPAPTPYAYPCNPLITLPPIQSPLLLGLLCPRRSGAVLQHAARTPHPSPFFSLEVE